jgi:hypothetical protein
MPFSVIAIKPGISFFSGSRLLVSAKEVERRAGLGLKPKPSVS